MSLSQAVEEVFENSLVGKTSRKGIAIKDCRKKETLVVVRYGGDVYMTIFDNETQQIMFDFVMQMSGNNQKNWSQIFRRFVEIKSHLVQQ
jgi:hypothetical protein